MNWKCASASDLQIGHYLMGAQNAVCASAPQIPTPTIGVLYGRRNGTKHLCRGLMWHFYSIFNPNSACSGIREVKGQ